MKNLFLVSLLSVFVFTACKKEATPILSEELVAVKTVAELDAITNTGVSMVFYHDFIDITICLRISEN